MFTLILTAEDPCFPATLPPFNKRILIKDSMEASPQGGIWDPPALVAAMGELDSLPKIKQFFFLKNLI